VSWYEGTTSGEMQKHVFDCVLRKLDGDAEGGKIGLEDVRLLDENETRHGEVVLCPFLPDGSHFLLKFKTSIERPPEPPKVNHRMQPYAPPYASRAPDSPSAEPSPFPSHANLASLDAVNGRKMSIAQQHQNEQQIQLLNTVAALLQQPSLNLGAHSQRNRGVLPSGIPPIPLMDPIETTPKDFPTTMLPEGGDRTTPVVSNDAVSSAQSGAAAKQAGGEGATPKMEPIAEDPTTDQLIEQQLRQLNELFAQRRSLSGIVGEAAPPCIDEGEDAATSMADGVTMNGTVGSDDPRRPFPPDVRARSRNEKRQAALVIANYLVLFVGCIALSAEIQARLPAWMQWVQQNYNSVQSCSEDRDALIECLQDGDFSGLVASFLLWATQSAAAKRIFLFGFDTPKKLWTVVYEALVTAACWGTSYLFIRRGLNPNTRENFLHKYWKDAVYGSLAGFNAAFMKAVLKNLVPQDVALEALEGGGQLKIFRWLGSLFYDGIED